MNILPLEVFVSLVLGFSSVLLWLFTNRQGDLDEADRLALLPLDDPPAPPLARAKFPGEEAPLFGSDVPPRA